jgi:hypothetical protein
MYYLYCNACCRGEGRLRNVTYLFLKAHLVKIDLLKVVSHNIAVYGNVSVLNEDLQEMTRARFLIRKPHNSMGGGGVQG